MSEPACDLCGGTVNVHTYAGGPCRRICEKCARIVDGWEEAKKAHRAWIRAKRKEADGKHEYL